MKKTVTRSCLALGVVRDLIREIRSARKYHFPELAEKKEQDLKTFYGQRHTTPFDQYGWPKCIKY